MLRRLNEALPNLVLGIIIYGIIIELIGVWFVDDKLRYSIGLWYGAAIAVGTAINLAQVIYDSVTLGDSDRARKKLIFKSVLRYVVIVVLFTLLGVFGFGNLFMAFVGMLGLKISAYAQPLLGKVINRIFGGKEDTE